MKVWNKEVLRFKGAKNGKKKELLKVLNMIKNYCKKHSETKDTNENFRSAKSCLLRNKFGGCV